MSRRPSTDEDTEAGILKRWSRRKARSGQGGAPSPEEAPVSREEPARDAPQPRDPAQDNGGEAEVQTEQVKTDDDMPDLDAIDETTNMSDFFSPGVSERLRNQALQRLFHTAKFNVVDGLDDYNENFRNFAPLGDMVTSDMRHRTEMEELRRQEQAEAAGAGEPAPGEVVEEEEERSEDHDEREEGHESERTAVGAVQGADQGADDGSDEAADPAPDDTDSHSDTPSRTPT